ncbi:hypothetical protein [Pyxidicoccus xibeiensis]|uniref:hypothetical protein n=1 Tax=Pyxidicoccus xibeiensis TaxID=2906759 RepID=UPI0020A833F2|nr:hypothetical protein [Pyxidicoccus xibeiensis]MCP3138207.1 hypothetical protein [Pyxidicoccus xibeiensis]
MPRYRDGELLHENEELQMQCPSCGRQCSAQAKWCVGCRTRFDTAPVGATPVEPAGGLESPGGRGLSFPVLVLGGLVLAGGGWMKHRADRAEEARLQAEAAAAARKPAGKTSDELYAEQQAQMMSGYNSQRAEQRKKDDLDRMSKSMESLPTHGEAARVRAAEQMEGLKQPQKPLDLSPNPWGPK